MIYVIRISTCYVKVSKQKAKMLKWKSKLIEVSFLKQIHHILQRHYKEIARIEQLSTSSYRKWESTLFECVMNPQNIFLCPNPEELRREIFPCSSPFQCCSNLVASRLGQDPDMPAV